MILGIDKIKGNKIRDLMVTVSSQSLRYFLQCLTLGCVAAIRDL